MTAASGLCWSVETSQHHKASLSSKMLKGLLLPSQLQCQLGLNQEHYCTGRVGLRCSASGRCGVALELLGQNSRPGEAGQNGHRFNGGPPNEHYGGLCEGRESPQVDRAPITPSKACTIRINCPTAMNLRHAWQNACIFSNDLAVRLRVENAITLLASP